MCLDPQCAPEIEDLAEDTWDYLESLDYDDEDRLDDLHDLIAQEELDMMEDW